MITVEEALEIIGQQAIDLGQHDIPLAESIGRVLAENLYSDRPLPPYDRVTMDGIAINYDGYAEGNGKLLIEGVAPAGAPQATLQNPGACLEVMTGAVLPVGTDTIIRYEDITIDNGYADVISTNYLKGKNVHVCGSDVPKGRVLVSQNVKIRSQEIGIAASIGKHRIKVQSNPRTVLISTGDELVDIEETPLPHQIRKSNSQTVAGLLSQWRIDAEHLHFPDNESLIIEKLRTVLDTYDLVILSGGVSKGKYDFIPEALKTLGTEKIFHKVRQRPGKPLWFGRRENTIVFGLPGNPVSSFVCARKYIFHWLEKTLDSSPTSTLFAHLSKDVDFKPDLHYFLPVYFNGSSDGKVVAEPFKGNGSGDFVNLKNSNAFIELPRGRDLFKAGEVLPLLPL